jgi:hypothetical protein
MRVTCHSLLAGAISCLAIPAFAALPEPGYWSFDSELNGKPGRGLQIERQGGETVILSYYGYRTDGTATFYQASGKMAKQETFTADLVEYKNGPALGGSIQSGEVSQPLGTVTVKFDTSQSGTISLPGESQKAISRYVYEDTKQRLHNQFSVSFFGISNHSGFVHNAKLMLALTEDGLSADLSTPDGVHCEYKGDLKREGSGFASEGQISPCNDFFNISQALTYARFVNLKVSDDGVLSGVYRSSLDGSAPFVDYHVFGRCYYFPGAVILGTPPKLCTPQRLGLEQPGE